MTVATNSGTQNPWGQFAGAGQEDISASDMRMPRLAINGKKGVFVHSTTKAEMSEFNCIVLGVIKQRAFFHKQVDEGPDKRPICKSNDFEVGFPSEPADQKHRLAFPWTAAGLDKTIDRGTDIGNENGHLGIKCDGCQMKEWNVAAKSSNGCDEVHTYAVLILAEDGSTSPALFSLKRSSMASSKAFISAFAQASGRPMFTAVTRIWLEQKHRGQVDYAVANFNVNMNETWGDVTMWDGYFRQLGEIRDMVRAAPRPDELDEPEPEAAPDNSWGSQAPQAPAANPWAQYSEPPTSQAPVPGVSTPPETPAPQVVPAPTPDPTSPPVAPVTAPTPPAAPTHQAAPPSPPAPPVAAPTASSVPAPTPAPPTPQPPVAAAPAPSTDDDELPF